VGAGVMVLVATGIMTSQGLSSVTGKVRCKGQPAEGAVVSFYRKGGDAIHEPTPQGIVGKDGTFALETMGVGKGAPPGEYDILILWNKEPRDANGAMTRRKHDPTPPDLLKGRYANPSKLPFHVTIKRGNNTPEPFEVVSD
jgi:hypothetical protein